MRPREAVTHGATPSACIATAHAGLALLATLVLGFARAATADPFPTSAARVRQHLSAVIELEPVLEERIRGLAEQAREDALAKTYSVGGRQIQGADQHPWIKANPQLGADPQWSTANYVADSVRAVDKQKNLTQNWSCFEPQLSAFGWWFSGPQLVAAPGLEAEALACKLYCHDTRPAPYEFWFPHPTGFRDNPEEPHQLDPEDNGFELIQFWWPEHEVAVNNYATHRLNPLEPLIQPDQKGVLFTRQRLLAEKRQGPEEAEKRLLAQAYPLDKQPNFPQGFRQDPDFGQGLWSGIATPDTEEKWYAHSYRSWVAINLADRAPNSWRGWLHEQRSIYDALPPKRTVKDPLHTFTEWGVMDVITSIPQLSYLIDARSQRGMTALYGAPKRISQAAAQKNAFWRTQGAASYRAARWSDWYGDLQSAVGIQPSRNPVLDEFVYRGGSELLPAVTNLSGFGMPALHASAIVARRAIYLNGSRSMVPYFPTGEKARMNEYTVSIDDLSMEVDKLQLIWPLLAGSFPSECFRSQRIPNFTEQSQDEWVAANLPSWLVGYAKEDFGDTAYMYHNKRFVCTCRIEGRVHGAEPLEFVPDGLGPGRGTGDRPYGRVEKSLCTYFEGQVPSAWAGADRPKCLTRPNVRQYKGINDRV